MAGPFYFAWAGGMIEEPVSLITNGTTHGGTYQTVSIVGDVTAGFAQIQNIASVAGLEIGGFYEITGPGIATGTWFIYDTGGGNKPDDSINLSQPASATAASASFLVTKSVILGSLPASISQGSSVAVLGDVRLAPGTYGIAGTGIGQTPAPVPTGTGITVSGTAAIMMVPSAAFAYTGDGNASMVTMVATPHSTTHWDPVTGIPLTTTTWSVAPQAVTATTSGTFPLQITGMPDLDWYTVDNIPADAIASLQPGLQYNISGPGIANGTTFIAPAAGATSITLDLRATDSQLNALLTITGPRTPNAPFDPVLHARFDEDVLSFEIGQDEGSFATLTIDIKNPQIGLLALGRNLWCWLSWDQAWTPEGGTPDLVPLFNGRLVGIPKLAADEVVQLQFLARPDDFAAQKDSIVSELTVLPYYDPIWLGVAINPDTVLETYSMLWHIDRTTLTVTASDVLQGEDGTITIGEDQAFYDSFSQAYGQPPLTEVKVSGTVAWQQQGDGFIDITDRIVSGFNAGGSPYIGTYATGGGMITVLNGDGLKSDWPKPGTNIGGGWSLTTLNDGSGRPLNYIIDGWKGMGGWMTPQYYNVVMAGSQAPPSSAGATIDQSNVNAFFNPLGQLSYGFPINIYKIRMTLQYKANRRRTETVALVMLGDVQRVLSDTSEGDRDSVEYSSEYVGQGVDLDGTVPIGDLRRRSYFQTERGARSVEYLLLAARAKMRFRSRAVDITFGVSFAAALSITLRNSISYFDRRLPGGSATGKVKSYRISAGSSMSGEFTIGCAVGNGNAATTPAGVNSYVADGYVDVGYQTITGGLVRLVAEELAYQPLDEFVIDDDGVDLANMSENTAVNEFVVTNGLLYQLQILSAFQGTVGPVWGDPISTMTTLTTTCTLDMRPVDGGEFHTNFFPAVSALALPKFIDLAAAAAGR